MLLHHLDAAVGFAVVLLLLSLVITIAVQLVVTVSGMRGYNLLWGLRRLLHHAGLPVAKQKALADTVLKHDLVRRSSFLPYVRRATDIHRDEFIRLLSTVAKHEKLEAEVNAAKKDIEDWFDRVMERTTERYVSKTRWIGVGLAIVLVIMLRVDVIHIFERIERDAGLRARLVAAAPRAFGLADSAGAVTAEAGRIASTALREARDSLDPQLQSLVPDSIPDDLRFRSDAEAWLAGNVTDTMARARLAAIFERTHERRGRESAARLDSSLTRLVAEVSDTTFILLRPGRAALSEPRHWLGMLLAVALISLGSPFWYNALRQLSNLRPVVATRIAQERQEGSQQDGAA